METFTWPPAATRTWPLTQETLMSASASPDSPQPTTRCTTAMRVGPEPTTVAVLLQWSISPRSVIGVAAQDLNPRHGSERVGGHHRAKSHKHRVRGSLRQAREPRKLAGLGRRLGWRVPAAPTSSLRVTLSGTHCQHPHILRGASLPPSLPVPAPVVSGTKCVSGTFETLPQKPYT